FRSVYSTIDVFILLLTIQPFHVFLKYLFIFRLYIYASAAVSDCAAILRFEISVEIRAIVLRPALIALGFSIAETACANFNLLRAVFSCARRAVSSSCDNSIISEFFIFISVLCRVIMELVYYLVGNGHKI